MVVFIDCGQHLSPGGLVEENMSVWLILICEMRRVITIAFTVLGEWAVHSVPTANWGRDSER